jgi:CreA protein
MTIPAVRPSPSPRSRRGSVLRPALLSAALLALAAAGRAESIGEVDTVFKWIGPDHKIVVDAYDDPQVEGVTCYVSRARTGGVKGALGLAEDKAEASIACRQVGPLRFKRPLPAQEEVFSERISLVFKKLRVVRMVDRKRNTLVYLTYSDRVIEGSPQNGVTAVPVGAETPIPSK